MEKKLVIELTEYDYTGSSQDIYGTITKVNGVELPLHNQDPETMIRQILEHLGFDVNVTYKYSS